MSLACSSVLTGGGTNQELALHCLHECRGDVMVSRPHCPAVSSFIFCYFLPLALFISLCFSRTLSLSHPYTHTHTHTHTHITREFLSVWMCAEHTHHTSVCGRVLNTHITHITHTHTLHECSCLCGRVLNTHTLHESSCLCGRVL